MLRRNLRSRVWIVLSVLLLCAVCGRMSAQQNSPAAPSKPQIAAVAEPQENTAVSAEALQKATQNPVASLISVPIQNNSSFNYGPYNRTQDVLNIQPVIPATLNASWNVITRIIQPIVWQPYPSQNGGGQSGLGDMNPSFFLSPAKPGKVIWGAGPAFVIPTATSTLLGQGKLSLGPSFVALAQTVFASTVTCDSNAIRTVFYRLHG